MNIKSRIAEGYCERYQNSGRFVKCTNKLANKILSKIYLLNSAFWEKINVLIVGIVVILRRFG